MRSPPWPPPTEGAATLWSAPAPADELLVTTETIADLAYHLPKKVFRL
jgi:hypothetical protein